MQSVRSTIRRVPQQLNRITKPTVTARNFVPSPATMSLFPRFTQEFAPMFRLFDEFDRQAFGNMERQLSSVRSFTPKFDVTEHKDSYELHGELPGIDQKDIDISWTDNNTLTIKGRHEHVREEGQRPQHMLENTNKEEQKKLEHQPTVEDESTPSTNTGSQVSKQSTDQEVAKADETHKPKYWVSERSVGEFHRSFAFPARVDQDAVKASLKNGILSIVVPKQLAQQARKINIE